MKSVSFHSFVQTPNKTSDVVFFLLCLKCAGELDPKAFWIIAWQSSTASKLLSCFRLWHDHFLFVPFITSVTSILSSRMDQLVFQTLLFELLSLTLVLYCTKNNGVRLAADISFNCVSHEERGKINFTDKNQNIGSRAYYLDISYNILWDWLNLHNWTAQLGLDKLLWMRTGRLVDCFKWNYVSCKCCLHRKKTLKDQGTSADDRLLVTFCRRR